MKPKVKVLLLSWYVNLVLFILKAYINVEKHVTALTKQTLLIRTTFWTPHAPLPH